VIGKRTRAREIALQALFCGDIVEGLASETAEDVISHSEAHPEVKTFAKELSLGVLGRIAEVDRHISAAADNWDIKRLAVVDRNVLRLAVYEMLARDDIPAAVSINEAIELSKRFSTAQSGGFVNGILDRVRKDLGLIMDGDDNGDMTGAALPLEDAPTAFTPVPEIPPPLSDDTPDQSSSDERSA
jgi:N utilization substance protein B